MLDTALVVWALGSLPGAPEIWPEPQATLVVWELEEVDGPALAFYEPGTPSSLGTSSRWIPGPLEPASWVLPRGTRSTDRVGQVISLTRGSSGSETGAKLQWTVAGAVAGISGVTRIFGPPGAAFRDQARAKMKRAIPGRMIVSDNHSGRRSRA